jgi:type IV secretory pathway TraG/TraD family ATPase VirD4
MLGALILWNIVITLFEAKGAPHQFDGLDTMLGLAFTYCASALAGSAWSRRNPTSAVQRGTVVIDDRGREPDTPRPGELTLAGRVIELADETKHFKIMGTTGTGKSTAILELLARAIARGDRAIIADPDGNYARHFYDPARGDVILNPFDERAVRWDLFAEIIEPHDADQIARSLIPDYEGQDRNWRAYARTFLTAVLRQLHRVHQRDIATLYKVLVTATEEELRDLLEGTPAAPFVGRDHKFLDSVRSVTMQHLAVIEHLRGQADREALSVRKWIREGSGVLFLTYKGNEIASIRTVISTWMRLAIFETMSLEEGDHRLWFVVDELDALGPIDGLKDALARLRKFGGRCVLGFQSIAQVRGTYGDSEAQTIVENCGNTLILRCSASERGGTAEFASRLIGKREVTRQQLSYSRPRKLMGFLNQTRTVAHQIATEDAVMASEIEQLPDLNGFLKRASRPEWHRTILPWKTQ